MSDGESLWAVISSWLTPSFFFLFLNLTIGIIAVLSNVAARKKQQYRHPHQQQQFEGDGADAPPPPMLVRAPSLIDRVRSFDLSSFYAYTPQSTPQPEPFQPEHHPADEDSNGSTPLTRAPSLLDRVKSFKFSFDAYSSHPDPAPQEPVAVPSDNPDPQVHVTEPATPELKAPVKMSKSLSLRWSFRSRNMEEEEEIDRRRPATVRERGSKAAARETEPSNDGGGDDGVDAKADDFINRFKQQLKLQRLDSLLRYRETALNRSSAGK